MTKNQTIDLLRNQLPGFYSVEQVGIAFRQWQKEWENYNGTKGNKPVSYDEFIKPFLEMEKQQIGEAYEDGYSDSDNNFKFNKEYYNETFKNK